MTTKNQIQLAIDEIEPNSWGATFQKIDWWDAERIATAKVMVVGAGALGNEVLKNLALLGIGHIFIVDFDQVEYGNLNRSILFREEDCGENKAKIAAKRIQEINPNTKVQYTHGDICIDVGLGIFRSMDVIIGCLDNRVARLFINRHCHKLKKVWIDGAIENLGGQLDVFMPDQSCYECQLSPDEWGIIEYRLGCADVAQRNANFGSIPTTPISSSVIGALQVQEALKIICNNSSTSMQGNRFRFYGRTNDFFFTQSADIKEDCTSHVHFDPIIEAKELSSQHTISQLLDWLSTHFDDPEAYVLLDEEIVLKVVSSGGLMSDIAMLKYHITEEEADKYKHTAEEELRFTEGTMVLDRSFPKPDLSLKEVGIPPLQILKIESREEIHFVELSGDKPFLNFN